MAAGVVWAVPILAWSAFGLAIATWIFISKKYVDVKSKPLRGTSLALATGAVALSLVGYVTAWPVFSFHKLGWLCARTMQLMHLLSLAGIVAAAFATPMIDAWGCYPPGTPLKDLSAGMCYKGSEACVLADTNLDCKPFRTAAETYGGVYALAINCQIIALHIWGVSFAWRWSHPDPPLQAT